MTLVCRMTGEEQEVAWDSEWLLRQEGRVPLTLRQLDPAWAQGLFAFLRQ